METSEHPPRRSRRSFLKLAHITAGALVLPAIGVASDATWHTPAQAAAQRPTVKIGVLVPMVSRYAALGAQLVDGMRLAFAHAAGRPIELQVVHYTSPSNSIAQARVLATDPSIAIITGFASANEAGELDTLLREQRTPFVVSDVGANVVHQPQQGYVFRSSLSHWQANMQLGIWAAQRGKHAVIATSFYEAGYDALYAFRHGFEQAGGEIMATHVTHAPTSKTDLHTTMGAMMRQPTDFVYAAYSGQEAVEFVTAYAAAGFAGAAPLVGPGFLTDEHLLPLQGSAAQGITSVAAWSPALPSAANRTFLANFAAATGWQADACAVLGYDTATLISCALDATGGNTEIDVFRQALGGATAPGPRGQVTIDSSLWETTSPLYLREVRANGSGYHNAVIADLGTSAALHGQAAALRSAMRSGWLYPYMSS